jgi:class 3 adenylate cyclase
MTTATLSCRSCGTQLNATAKFCSECGTPVAPALEPAEFKQVTVDKFTGDGIMALFGAPVALEDHAIRACLAALDIQRETERLAAEIERCDGIALQLRVGLNSGRVITGEIGATPMGYTAIGEQVGMAQRMESVAPSGGVMLSESTARLVEDVAVLGEPDLAHMKGADTPVPARRLLDVAVQPRLGRRASTTLVGRDWEHSALGAILDRSISGKGSVVGVVGPAGIGKSRLVAEMAAIASGRAIDVFSTFCESHASEIPFHAVARLLRAGSGVGDLDGTAARAQVRTLVTTAMSSNPGMSTRPFTPSAVVGTPSRCARRKPSESGSIPTIAPISSSCDSRSTLIIRSVPILPEPITATLVRVIGSPRQKTPRRNRPRRSRLCTCCPVAPEPSDPGRRRARSVPLGGESRSPGRCGQASAAR